MKISWITPLLGTAAASEVHDNSGIAIVDVRDLVDRAGNRSEAMREKIREGVESLAQGRTTVICCDYGISRSNAVATGILASMEHVPFEVALRRVLEATGETQIKLEPLNAAREALGLRTERKHDVRVPTVLVTGGAGFLGRAVCSSLGNEFRVVAPTRDELDISLGSTQLDLLAAEKGVGYVLHLASPRVYASNVAMGQTLTMLRNVIDVCVARDISLIYPSGWEIYSGYAGMLRANESTPALPRGPYGETKWLAELLIDYGRRTAGLRCALLRSGPVYGSGGDKPKFICTFIEKARRGQTIVTHRYRNGHPALDLLHIEDLIVALAATLRSGFAGTLNLGTGELTSTRRIAQMLRDRLGSGSLIEESDIDADVASIAMNWRLAQKELGWQPTLSLEQGLERLVSDITTNGR